MSYSKEETEKTNEELDHLAKEKGLNVGRIKIRGPTLLSKMIIRIKKTWF